MAEHGYAGRSLISKLGLKPAMVAAVVAPADCLLEAVRAEGLALEVAEAADGLGGDAYDYLHVFVRSRAELAAALPILRGALLDRGMLWVSWPKRAARLPTDLTENVVRQLALDCGLVDIKVCAVDAVWSGLKLVVPVARRRT